MIHGGRVHASPTASALRRSGMQTSSGPFKCKFCEKRFLHRGSWWRHQKMFCAVNPEIPSVKAETKVRNVQGVPSFACRFVSFKILNSFHPGILSLRNVICCNAE